MHRSALNGNSPGRSSRNINVTADERQRLTRLKLQLALIHSNAPTWLIQETKRLGCGHRQTTAGLVQCREARAVGKAHLVRCADVERARHVEFGIGSEHHT